jgi:hypothetical protein
LSAHGARPFEEVDDAMDHAVLKIIKALEAKRSGTRARTVAQRALELGYELVPPASGSGATYLRLIRKSQRGGP